LNYTRKLRHCIRVAAPVVRTASLTRAAASISCDLCLHLVWFLSPEFHRRAGAEHARRLERVPRFGRHF